MYINRRSKNLKILATILSTTLFTVYSWLALLSLWMLYVISFPSTGQEVTALDLEIGYLMFSVLLILGVICSLSTWWSSAKDNVSRILVWPSYLFLPLSIPYLIVKRNIKGDYQQYEINDRLFSIILLSLTSILSYLYAIPMLLVGSFLTSASSAVPLVLYFSIPIIVICIFMIIGTTANIINYFSESKLALRLSYLGLGLVWIYKIYKISLLKNNLVSPSNKKIKMI